MAEKKNLRDIVRGDTVSYKFVFDDGGDPTLHIPPNPINIADWSLWIAFKSDLNDEDGAAALLIKNTAGDNVLDSVVDGVMHLVLPSIDTALIEAGKYHYAIHRVIEGTTPIEVKTLMYGMVKIIEDVVVSTAVDTTPTQFTFVDQTDVSLGSEIISDAIIVKGINFPSAITIAGDASSEYSINGGDYKSSADTVKLNDVIRVRHTASAINNTQVDSILTIGTVTDTFSSTTIA